MQILGKEINRTELESIPVPVPTDTHFPVAHSAVLDLLEKEAGLIGMPMENIRHGISHSGLRLFGVAEIVSEILNPEAKTIVAFRNSHDKSFPVGFALGQRITICSNLMFGGEVVIKTRHTKRVWDRIPGLINRAVGQLQNIKVINEKRVEAYKDHEINNDAWVHDFLVRSVDRGILAAQNIPKVLHQWREPEHTEFEPRTLWSLNNAYTDSFKIYKNLEQVTSRNIKLSGFMDKECGLDFRTEIELSEDQYETLN